MKDILESTSNNGYWSLMIERKTVQVGIRMTQALRDAVALCAARETRSMSQQIEHFILQGLERYRSEHPDFEPMYNRTFEYPGE